MLHIYDGTFDGFMTTIFNIYSNKDNDASILSETRFNNNTFLETVYTETDMSKSERVQNGLIRLDGEAAARIYTAWLSHLDGIEDLILACIRLGFTHNANPFSLLQYECVVKLEGIARKVGFTAHRMLMFTRFVKAKPEVFDSLGGLEKNTVDSDLYVADIEPEYDIIELIGSHFHDRFPNSRFMIRDIKHLKAIISIPGGWHITNIPENYPPLPVDGGVEAMWRMYFKTVAIKQRTNQKLQQQFVPKKFRRFMTEFIETSKN